ncbi:MAG: M36 family metallopeptidase [Nocardioidaceae bacterium]
MGKTACTHPEFTMSAATPNARARWVRAGLAAALVAGPMPLLSVTSPVATGATTRTAGSVGTGVVALASDSQLVPSDVRLYRTRTSLLGRHEWYRQVRAGRVVVGGVYARHYDLDGNLVSVWDGRRKLSGGQLADVEIGSSTAMSVATAESGDMVVERPELMVLPAAAAGTDRERLVWAVDTEGAEGPVVSYVDAQRGVVLEQDNHAKFAGGSGSDLVTGRGRVFDPNPVVARQNQTLLDRRDRSTVALERAYRIVNLPRLRESRGLAGRWVRIMDDHRAVSATDRYVYSRTNDRFEQVMAYFAVDRAQAYLQGLGFRDVNAESQAVVTDRYPDDNSFYNEGRDVIQLGSGGVDDAEDVEIIWHEYAHAIQDDQVPGFGARPQSGAIGEGFGDYFAVTMSAPTTRDTVRTPLACVADWDSVSYDRTAPHCLRRVDGRLTYDDRTFDIHHDGRIWSRALWDISRTLEPTKPGQTARAMANRLIIEAQFWMQPRITMPAAARITVRTARDLDGASAATTVRSAFAARGILPG